MTRTVPELALTSPATAEISVVLPAPLGPSSPKNSPSWTWSETPWSAVNDPYRLTTESMSMALDMASERDGEAGAGPRPRGAWRA